MPIYTNILRANFVSEPVSGTVSFLPSRTGIKINLDLKKSNTTSQNNYHIHDGNCNNNPKHWDFKSVKVEGKPYDCIATDFEACESGDLAGKFGPLKGGEIKYHYVDNTVKYNDMVHKDLSVVVHKPGSKDVLVCADIKKKLSFGWY